MTSIVYSPQRLGLSYASEAMLPVAQHNGDDSNYCNKVTHVSGSGFSDVQPDIYNSLEYRIITNVDGRSRTVVDGHPTTPNLFDCQSDSNHSPQAKAEQKNANQMASPDKHDLSANKLPLDVVANASITKSHLTSLGTCEEAADVQDLQITYLLTFDKAPEGPHCEDATWLEAQILRAHRDVLKTGAGAGKRTDQLISDERFAKTLADTDARTRARSTRSATHQANVIATSDGNLLQNLQQHQQGNPRGGILGLSTKGLSKGLRNSGRQLKRAQHSRRSGSSDLEDVDITEKERRENSAAESADRQRRGPGTLHSSLSIIPVQKSSIRPVASSDPAFVGKVVYKTARVVPSNSGPKRARRKSQGTTGSGDTHAKSARTVSFDVKLNTNDMTPYPEATLDAASFVLPISYVPQHQLKLVLNQIIAEHVSAITYANTSIAMSETDQFLTCVHIEDKLLQHSYNSMSYIDFILHHFVPGHALQTCAERRSTFADSIRANGTFMTHVVPPKYLSCFMEISCDVTFKSPTSRTDIAEYIVEHTNMKNLDTVGFTVAAIVQYGGILHGDHFVALNGEDFDSMDASTQQLITRPLDSIDTFRALLQEDRPDWMGANKRLSTQSTDFSVNGVSLPALCTRPIDLVNLNNMLTAQCKVQMPEPTEWMQKLTINTNDLQFPMDTCFPSHNETLHGPQINIRLPHTNEAYCDISTSLANFLAIAVPSASSDSSRHYYVDFTPGSPREIRR
jgi:hypothetical protein